MAIKVKKIREALNNEKVQWVEQKEQLGTGHALLQALPAIAENDQVLILYGDVPLISSDTLSNLIAGASKDSICMLTAVVDNPKGYGRIKRDFQGKIVGIVEEKDASPDEREINEINPGIYLCASQLFKKMVTFFKQQKCSRRILFN